MKVKKAVKKHITAEMGHKESGTPIRKKLTVTSSFSVDEKSTREKNVHSNPKRSFKRKAKLQEAMGKGAHVNSKCEFQGKSSGGCNSGEFKNMYKGTDQLKGENRVVRVEGHETTKSIPDSKWRDRGKLMNGEQKESTGKLQDTSNKFMKCPPLHEKKKSISSPKKVKSRVKKSLTKKQILCNVHNKSNIDDHFIKVLKEQCEDFHKIEHFFEDVSLDDFAGPAGEYNEWSLPEILLLLHRMEESMRGDWEPVLDIDWESIDSPREGAKKIWKAIISILPETMEQAIARVKTLLVSRISSKKNGRTLKWHPDELCRKELMLFKWKCILNAVAVKTSNVIKEDLLDETSVYQAMSPLGKLIVSVAAWDALTASYLKTFQSFVDTTVS